MESFIRNHFVHFSSLLPSRILKMDKNFKMKRFRKFWIFFLEKEKFWILINKIINLGSNMKPRCKLASLLFIYYLYISPLTKLRITYSLSYQFFYRIKNKTQFTIETISQEGAYFTLNIFFFFFFLTIMFINLIF